MANRNDSDARQHETLPGPGPGSSAPIGGAGRPVEQMMDAAIERIAREQKGELSRRNASEVALARRHAAAQAMKAPTRLRWKGLDVSEEFRQYAERIARGEELPPFEGRVLAEPNPAFPWGDGEVAEAPAGDATPPQRAAHPVVWGAALVVLGLIGWSIAVKVAAPDPNLGAEANVPTTASMELEPAPSAAPATPADVVETPALGATTTSAEGANSEAAVLPAPEAVASETGVPPSVAPPSGEASHAAPTAGLDAQVASPISGATSSVSTSSVAPAGPSVHVDLAKPGALGAAIGAALAGRGAAGAATATAPAGATPAPTTSNTVRDDEFGIMATASAAPAAAPGGAPTAVPPAPTGAKSNGSVGDLARVGPPGGAGARKEPGSESSAKGSLLVETPSF